LARTGATYGITVNAIVLRIIKTDLLFRMYGEDRVKILADGMLLGLGTVDDIGLVAVLLSSDEASYRNS
jgi:NAD(P)-dependent dehydrogenase (short-subunit alcohol dehydrogenase family)